MSGGGLKIILVGMSCSKKILVGMWVMENTLFFIFEKISG
jgi:hypothetical protein